jgi:hypothetical protein
MAVASIRNAVALCALLAAGSASYAQAPSPFDGKYVGRATAQGSVGSDCATVAKVVMTITGGQVEVHEIWVTPNVKIFQGSVDPAGNVTANLVERNLERHPYDLRPGGYVRGTIHGTQFTGQRSIGRCEFAVQLQKK